MTGEAEILPETQPKLTHGQTLLKRAIFNTGINQTEISDARVTLRVLALKAGFSKFEDFVKELDAVDMVMLIKRTKEHLGVDTNPILVMNNGSLNQVSWRETISRQYFIDGIAQILDEESDKLQLGSKGDPNQIQKAKVNITNVALRGIGIVPFDSIDAIRKYMELGKPNKSPVQPAVRNELPTIEI